MNKYRVSIKDYTDYLVFLRKSIFKILPLYEESNKYLIEYIDDAITDVIYVKDIIEELPYGAWYVQTLGSLRVLRDEVSKENNHKKVKKRVLSTGKLVIQQLNLINENIIEKE